ncbi:hypothetical protein [Avibacterium volantium]|uniref:Uncharacterized protein n=1 Tax=Avibacterium volantium TaxID=762 RepID=A0A447ST90_AVIVO|nr:hypothetical protein [Avibacterium volantium]VEB25196.1 Uncharacterised protein [Avibacterium volantium]
MIGVPFSLLPFFWVSKRKEVAQRAKPVINHKEKHDLTVKEKLYFLPFGKCKRKEVANGEIRYQLRIKKQFNDKTKTLLLFIRERKRKYVAQRAKLVINPNEKQQSPK